MSNYLYGDVVVNMSWSEQGQSALQAAPQEIVKYDDAEFLKEGRGWFGGDEEDSCPTSLSRASTTPHANLNFPRLLNHLSVNHRTDLRLLGLL